MSAYCFGSNFSDQFSNLRLFWLNLGQIWDRCKLAMDDAELELYAGMSDLVLKWVRLANCNFSDQISVFFADFLVWKKTNLVHLQAYLTHFGAKSELFGCKLQGAHDCHSRHWREATEKTSADQVQCKKRRYGLQVNYPPWLKSKLSVVLLVILSDAWRKDCNYCRILNVILYYWHDPIHIELSPPLPNPYKICRPYPCPIWLSNKYLFLGSEKSYLYLIKVE